MGAAQGEVGLCPGGGEGLDGSAHFATWYSTSYGAVHARRTVPYMRPHAPSRPHHTRPTMVYKAPSASLPAASRMRGLGASYVQPVQDALGQREAVPHGRQTARCCAAGPHHHSNASPPHRICGMSARLAGQSHVSRGLLLCAPTATPHRHTAGAADLCTNADLRVLTCKVDPRLTHLTCLLQCMECPTTLSKPGRICFVASVPPLFP